MPSSPFKQELSQVSSVVKTLEKQCVTSCSAYKNFRLSDLEQEITRMSSEKADSNQVNEKVMPKKSSSSLLA